MNTSVLRGAVLVAVAALLGFLILSGVEDRTELPITASGVAVEATPTPVPTEDVTTTTLPEPEATVDTSSARPPSQVAVLVANSTDVAGQAGRLNDMLRNQGFSTRQPTNADSERPASVIYFRPGFDVEAEVVRNALNARETPVAPMPVPDPILGEGIDLLQVDVLVLIGADALSASGS